MRYASTGEVVFLEKQSLFGVATFISIIAYTIGM
ncbi:unnamed protein product [Acanthoscelides obtectus]|uniref:Uncharacterized protein n=1 Tax=Acanthoscelides obtectus TaxID=200917 RepID=A0A9P0K8C1_ACAOB|nr:unnamed protein product [Acanthoscelides obtectus]CAK1640363.1 hypothetical protein AOBTE_LOCUS11672 [Acanthoscelides obtectus]